MPCQSGRRGPVRKNAARPTGEFVEPGEWTYSGYHTENALLELDSVVLVNEYELKCRV